MNIINKVQRRLLENHHLQVVETNCRGQKKWIILQTIIVDK